MMKTSSQLQSIDQDILTPSSCYPVWTGELKEPKMVKKVSIVYMKIVAKSNVSVLVGMKGEKLQRCAKVKQALPIVYQFDCFGHVGDHVEIEMEGKLFDVKVSGEFKIFLLFLLTNSIDDKFKTIKPNSLYHTTEAQGL